MSILGKTEAPKISLLDKELEELQAQANPELVVEMINNYIRVGRAHVETARELAQRTVFYTDLAQDAIDRGKMLLAQRQSTVQK